MAHPITHAESSARRYGGVPEDYLEIHDFMDSSKAAFPDNRHRALTHTSWFIFVVERVFGHEIDLTCPDCRGRGKFHKSDGSYSQWTEPCSKCRATGRLGKAKVRYVCEQHILEDFGGKFIPTPADFLGAMEFEPWMNNGVEGEPASQRKMEPAPPGATYDRPNAHQRGMAFTLD